MNKINSTVILMNKHILMVLFVAFLFPLPSYGAAKRPSSKPQSSLIISISFEDRHLDPDDIEPGSIINLIITATSHTDADDVHIEIRPSDRLQVIVGELEWKGPVNKGESRVMTIQVRSPESGKAEIRATAFLMSDGGTALSAVSSLSFGKAEKRRPTMNSVTTRGNNGKGIIERIIKK